ncbi:DUF1707 domain-containing protein [Brevibacterium sp. 5221]|uniref:DUF1707 domain-containing protein n=1 Tax=Brevibacterium rongguiense TaxID=2695267 RepID=A0A6N9H340_9MICO|nr:MULTISPECIES: DUF1707 domain-containing protein [Brevibacterium]MYM18470.1 DUF1707 domain-containing protein [Brevibacterium rongguiense]WAL41522.1 DUF1707 domain-containing protein [Brevibacterium sp. BRM-1]
MATENPDSPGTAAAREPDTPAGGSAAEPERAGQGDSATERSQQDGAVPEPTERGDAEPERAERGDAEPERAVGGDPAPAGDAAARRVRASDADRDAVLAVLGQAHAHGRLDAGEFDERQSAVLGARFVHELIAPIDDVPEGDGLAADMRATVGLPAAQGPAVPGTAIQGAAAQGTAPRGAATGAPAVQGPGTVQGRAGAGAHSTSVAVLSGSTTHVPEGETSRRAYAVMAGDDIYLAEAMGPGVEYVLDCYALMAGHDIYVPPGVRIIDRTVNILAGSDVHPEAKGDGSNGTLVLKGVSIMAGHDIRLDEAAALPPARS